MPRPNIILSGRFRVNPPTANNNNVEELVDVERTGLALRLSGVSTAANIVQLKQLKSVETYWDSQQQTTSLQMPCYWNYFGDNAFTWEEVKVTAVDEPFSQQQANADKVLDAVAMLQGHARHETRTNPVMFQLDGTDASTAQVIADRLEVQGEGCHLLVTGLSRAHLRDVNAFRQEGNSPRQVSGVFQTAAASADVEIKAGESRVLAALAEELRNGRRLVITYCLYDCGDPPLDPTEMNRALLDHDAVDVEARAPLGQARGPRNPKHGRIVVVISTAPAGALDSMPAGRRLIPAANADGAPRLGPAYVEVDPDTKLLTLNTMSSLPEELTGGGIAKRKLGALRLRTTDDAGQTTELRAWSEGDYAEYARNAGIFRTQLNDDEWTLLRQQRVSIELDCGSRLIEQDYVLASDQRNIYLEHDGSEQVYVLVTRRGVPAAGVRLQVGVWQSRVERRGERSDGIPKSPLQNFHKTDAPNVEIEPLPIETDGKGVAGFRIRALRPGAALICYWIDGDGPPQVPTWEQLELYSFSAVRVLPDDSKLANKDPLLWEDVFENVLKPYTVLYPAMNEVFSLDNEASVRNHRQAIEASMDAKAWAETTYMPISRDLSRGKREMLLRWLKQ